MLKYVEMGRVTNLGNSQLFGSKPSQQNTTHLFLVVMQYNNTGL
jgi:hypothetical protein